MRQWFGGGNNKKEEFTDKDERICAKVGNWDAYVNTDRCFRGSQAVKALVGRSTHTE